MTSSGVEAGYAARNAGSLQCEYVRETSSWEPSCGGRLERPAVWSLRGEALSVGEGSGAGHALGSRGGGWRAEGEGGGRASSAGP